MRTHYRQALHMRMIRIAGRTKPAPMSILGELVGARSLDMIVALLLFAQQQLCIAGETGLANRFFRITANSAPTEVLFPRHNSDPSQLRGNT
eukprot:3171857-Pleurochrysis_carterae.AAC.2